jgi:hypothetical protein
MLEAHAIIREAPTTLTERFPSRSATFPMRHPNVVQDAGPSFVLVPNTERSSELQNGSSKVKRSRLHANQGGLEV